jgi:hypothetical protein
MSSRIAPSRGLMKRSSCSFTIDGISEVEKGAAAFPWAL